MNPNDQEIINEFRALEMQGAVRLRACSDAREIDECEDDREEILSRIHQFGCWQIAADYLSPDDSEWRQVNSVGRCICRNVFDPEENPWVLVLMRDAVRRYRIESGE